MGIFDSAKPKVSKKEFDRAMSQLRAKGLSERDVDDLRNLYSGSLDETGSDKGIDRKELERGFKELEKNAERHGLSKKQVKTAEEELKEEL